MPETYITLVIKSGSKVTVTVEPDEAPPLAPDARLAPLNGPDRAKKATALFLLIGAFGKAFHSIFH
jgi:hypothetical protein